MAILYICLVEIRSELAAKNPLQLQFRPCLDKMAVWVLSQIF